MRLRLSTRIILSVVLIEVVMLSILVWNSVRLIGSSHAELLENSIEEEGVLIVNLLAPGLMANDHALIEDSLSLLKNKRGLVYMDVHDRTGAVVATLGEKSHLIDQQRSHDGKHVTIIDGENVLHELDKSYEDALSDGVFDFRRKIEIYGQFLGSMRAGYSIESVKHISDKTRFQNALIAMIELVLSIMATVLLGYFLTRSLRELEAGAHAVGEGELQYRINIKSKDEIGDFARSFNQMAKNLSQSQAGLEERNRVLTEREQNLAITLNSIGDAVITTDANGNVTRMNPVAEQLTGWLLHDAEGQSLKNIFNIVDATTRELIDNPVEKVLKTGEIVYLSNHTTLISKDGVEYQIADSAAPIRSEDNIILGMVLVFNDVTEQYQLREVASKSKRDLQSIMDNSPAVIYVKDTEGRFTFINRQFVELFHVQPDDIVGKKLSDVFPEDLAEEMEMNDKDVLMTLQVLESEETIRHEDGFHTYISTRFPLRDKDDKVYAVCVISTDVTDRKLKDEQIRRSQKMDALGKLTGGIAHDYNNMLGIILGYSELLQTMVSDQPDVASFVQEIHHAGERGAKLTKKLLTFTRQKSAESESLSLNTLLMDSKLMLEKTMTVRINLVLDLAVNLWPIYIDVSDLEDAILNMCINAMHAMEDKGQLTIETRNEVVNETDSKLLHMEKGDYVLLSITDTGCGMDEETKEKVFDPFFSTKGDKGTGLGLSQVYGLVQRSKGAVKIYSELGHGTRFILYFPRYFESKNEKYSRDEINDIDLRGSETILIVDDEPALIKLTAEILNKQGYHCLSANNGLQALKVLETESVDLLLSDVIMPEMDGYQLSAVVIEKYPDIKIQLASGFSDDRHVDMVDDSLHQNIIHKPYHSLSLLRRIRELLS